MTTLTVRYWHETHLPYTSRPEQLTGWKGNNGLQFNQMLDRE
jgi:hypothetical protein